jgi:Trypsin
VFTLAGLIIAAGVGPVQSARSQGNPEEQSPLAVGSLDTAGVKPFRLLIDEVSSDEIQIFNGVSPRAGDWSSLMIARLATAGAATPPCTAVLVGPRAALTAAHCVVAGNGTIHPLVLRMGASFRLPFRCTVNQAYLAGGNPGTGYPWQAMDYALCALEPGATPPPRFALLPREVIDLTPVAAQPPDVLVISGYGCQSFTINPVTLAVSWGAQLEAFTIGDAKVSRVDTDNFVSHSDGRTQQAICLGDSGGPAFSGISTAAPSGTRWVRGVASYLRAVPGGAQSHFASLSTPGFRRFAACWNHKNPQADLRTRQPLPPPSPQEVC